MSVSLSAFTLTELACCCLFVCVAQLCFFFFLRLVATGMLDAEQFKNAKDTPVKEVRDDRLLKTCVPDACSWLVISVPAVFVRALNHAWPD